jgi:metal-responsive CopG/Arc/MetJ family transcriptional regulator
MMTVNKVLAKRKGPGRPRKDDPNRSVVAVALSVALLSQLDEWMAERGITSRSEALRGFVERGLKQRKK